MDKQKEKTLVAEAEKFLQQLVDNGTLTSSQIQILLKKYIFQGKYYLFL